MEDVCRIIVRTQFEAIHFWEDAKSFLKFPHHHRFFVEMKIRTIPGDMDRTLEFFEVKELLNQAIEQMLVKYNQLPQSLPRHLQFDRLGFKVIKMSTEKMSEEILESIGQVYSDHDMSVKVMEDDFNGSKTRRSAEVS